MMTNETASPPLHNSSSEESTRLRDNAFLGGSAYTRSYQSGDRDGSELFVVNEEGHCDNVSTTTGRSSFFGGKLPFVLGAMAVVALYGVTQRGTLPDEYASILKEYSNPPLLGRGRDFARAQDIAQKQRETSLGADLQSSHHHKGKKHHDKDGKEPPAGCEGTVMLVRHCEKEHNYEHCAYTGYERSVYLPTLFGNGDEKWPMPSYIFALNPGERNTEWKKNYREVETIMPLAQKANVTINAEYGYVETSKLAKHIHGMLRSGEMCGKLAVVSWKHEDLPKLAHRLGCGPIEGCPLDYHGNSFDEVWQIKFVYLLPRHATTKHDAKKGIVPRTPKWWVFGDIQHEGFDPLAYSKVAGDYPEGGTRSGGRWRPDFEDKKLQELKHDKLQMGDKR